MKGLGHGMLLLNEYYKYSVIILGYKLRVAGENIANIHTLRYTCKPTTTKGCNSTYYCFYQRKKKYNVLKLSIAV